MKYKEFLVGLVTIIGIVILIISIVWGKNYSSERKYKEIDIKFQSINNLDIGNPVELRGVNIGFVKDINLTDSCVIVIAEIFYEIAIYSDASAIIANKELMGGRKLILDQGTSKTQLDGIVNGKESKGLTESFSKLGDILDKLDPLFFGLEKLVSKVDSIMPKKNLDDRLEKIESELVLTLKESRKLMNEIDDKLISGMKGFTELSDSLSNVTPEITEMIRHFSTFSNNMSTIGNNLNDLILSLNDKTSMITDTTGSLGSLVQSREIYEKLKSSLTNLDSVLTDIKKNGVKVNMSLF
ncbi:MAG: MCE family protein [Candidatus Delongbacteria bacterium]|nr:MCE family protein [Candidatus Delongbacteria bacterium]MBN2836034.1 MCE family protein [Candidatus Delongbacteria bacterium]